MPAKRTQRKSNWKDRGDLRKPNATFQARNAARFCAGLLHLPEGAVTLLRPDGSQPRANDTLGALREEWKRHPSDL